MASRVEMSRPPRRPSLPFGRLWPLAPCLLASGCAWLTQRDYPDALVSQGILAPDTVRPWPNAYAFEGAHCSVRANIGPRVAEHLGALLDAEWLAIERIFGETDTPKVSVRAYATLSEFQRSHWETGFTPRTCGQYDPTANEIALALTKHRSGGPSMVLLHEGAHAYLHNRFDFAVPPALSPAVGRARLSSVPWWLHEGFASYVEASPFREGGLRTGLVNPTRYQELRRLIKRRRQPSVRAVVASEPARCALSARYAVAWGLVYTRMHHPDPAVQRERRERLRKYLLACKRGFFRAPERDFARKFMPNGQLVQDFEERWRDHVKAESLTFFQRLIVGEGQTLKEWERGWVAEAVQLGEGSLAPQP